MWAKLESAKVEIFAKSKLKIIKLLKLKWANFKLNFLLERNYQIQWLVFFLTNNRLAILFKLLKQKVF